MHLELVRLGLVGLGLIRVRYRVRYRVSVEESGICVTYSTTAKDSRTLPSSSSVQTRARVRVRVKVRVGIRVGGSYR